MNLEGRITFLVCISVNILNATLRGYCGITSWPKDRSFRVRCGELLTFSRSQVSSSGYKCCTARSSVPLPAQSCTTRIIPSHPEISSSTIPIFHLLRFCSSSLMMATSPLARTMICPLCFIQCRSLSPHKYLVVHLDHKACLHFSRYFARLCRSTSSKWCGSSSGSWFDRRNNNELGISTSSCMSSSR